MPRVVFNGVVIAESNNCQKVEGNFYFPPDSLKEEYFEDFSALTTTCGWKGTCNYRAINVNGQRIADAVSIA
jgi:uncharacterized protein (DUF427 family)